MTRSLSPNRVPSAAASPAIASAPGQSPVQRAQQRGGHEQEAPLRAVAVLVLEQPQAARDPATGGCRLAAVDEDEDDPAGARDRPSPLAAAQQRLMRPLPHRDALVVLADADTPPWRAARAHRAPATWSGPRRTARRTHRPTPAGRTRRPRCRPTRGHPTPEPSRRHDDQNAQRGADAGQQPDEALVRASEGPTAHRLLDVAVPPVRVGRAEDADDREADADGGVRPRRAGGERWHELSGPDADCERRQARPPPREVGALIGEPGSPRGVTCLVEAPATRRLSLERWHPRETYPPGLAPAPAR